MNQSDFIDIKNNALNKLNEAKQENLVDKKIIPILDILNNSENFFTSSSCSGRIVLLELPKIGDKKNAEFLGKWHREINKSDVLKATEKTRSQKQMWLLAQPPIMHVFCKNLESANHLMKICISSGFKHSTFKSTRNKIIVEICSTERLDFPVGKHGKLLCNDDHLEFLVKISNNIINRSDEKLKRLEEKLKKLL